MRGIRKGLASRAEDEEVVNYLLGLPLSAVMGMVGAVAASFFSWCLIHAMARLYGGPGDITEQIGAMPWYVQLLLPAVGSALGAWLLLRARRVEKVSGLASEYLETVDGKTPYVPVQASLLRCVSSFFTIVSGGSIGKEGAMVQLAAMAGSFASQRLHWREAELRLAVATAATGGLASVYHTPLAAAIFIAEIAYGGLEMRRIGYLFTAAMASSWLIQTVLGKFAPLYALPAFAFDLSGAHIVPVFVVGVICGAVASIFMWCVSQARRAFAVLHDGQVVRMVVGGLIVGAITLITPEVAGNGFEPIYQLLHTGTLGISVFLLLVLKIVATSATVGSGSIGGLFTPSLMIGVLSGVVCAPLAHWFGVPDGEILFGVIGMAAALTATTQAPLMAMLMVFEMTQETAFIFPLMVACVAAYAASQPFRQGGIYGIVARHRARDEVRGRMVGATVEQAMRDAGPLVPDDTTLAEAMRIGNVGRHRFVFVIDADQQFVGAVGVRELTLRTEAGEGDARKLRDFVIADFPVVQAGQRLMGVWQTVASAPAERIPVLGGVGGRRVLGVLRKSELLEQAGGLFG